jgi:uncharacterized protein (DUF849 family)
MVASWTERPNFVSVNFSEPDALGLCQLLLRLGIGVEAGLWTAADAEVLLDSGFAHHLVRALVEPPDVDPEAAEETADRISMVLDRGDVIPRVYHGNGIATWRVIEYALDGRWDVRVGLEDTLHTPDGSHTGGNALLVLEVVSMARKRGLLPPA